MGPLFEAQLMIAIGKLMLAAAIPILLIWLILNTERIGPGLLAVLSRVGLVRPVREPQPVRVPLERIAADLCRLATTMRDAPRGVSRVRHTATLLAYDDRLASAALALDVPHALEELPLGLDRDLERLRVEAGLRAAGLVFGPRKRQDMP